MPFDMMQTFSMRGFQWATGRSQATSLGLGQSKAAPLVHVARHGCSPRRVLPPLGAASGKGGKHEHDLHDMTNVDAEPMASDPGDLGRVAEGVLEEAEHLQKLGGQQQQPSKRTSKNSSGGSARAGKRGGGSGRRRKKDDPHNMSNVDREPLMSDPGDLGRVAEGVLEKYEHLQKLSHCEEGEGGGPAGTRSSGGQQHAEPTLTAASEADVSDTLKTDSPGGVETQHPGEASAALMQEKKEFEGTGGVLLDVSHTTPHPYHGEGVGRREEVGKPKQRSKGPEGRPEVAEAEEESEGVFPPGASPRMHEKE